jgi:clan AA aspartic protease (TIGR02281 family)
MNSDFLRLRISARLVLGVAALAIVAATGCTAAPASRVTPPVTTAIPMKEDGGVYVVPVSVDGMATFDCIVDSGASDVNIPADVFQKLVRAGKIQKSDFLGTQDYTLADGSNERGRTIRIKSLKVGNIVVTNVVASIGADGSSALLGQSFLERFRSWSVDNGRHALMLVGPPSAPAPVAVATASEPRPVDGPPSVANDGHHSGGRDSNDHDSDGDAATVAQTPDGHASHEQSDPSDDQLTSQQGQASQ